MDTFQALASGLSAALEPSTLLMCLLGVTWGTLVGVLPGIGPIGGMAILLPLTYRADPSTAVVMLFGVYYGTMFGGATTSILLGIPGESTSMVTTLDGHPMAKKGRPGAALTIAMTSSFVSGTIGICGLAFLAPLLASWALDFAPPEYFALALLALTMAAFITSNGQMVKGLSMMIVGVMVSTIGMHIITGNMRYDFNLVELSGGIELVAAFMGLFGIAEVIYAIGMPQPKAIRSVNLFNFRALLPTSSEIRQAVPTMLRAGTIGFFMGTAPGGGGDVSTYVTYGLEKRISRYPELFGTGIPEGVAAPEAANNGGAVGQMIVLLTLGVPFGVISGIMLAAMMAHGIYPSPLMMVRNPEFFYTVVGSMYVANAALLVLNIPLVGVWASVLRIPQRWLYTAIIMFCFIGVYCANGKTFDMGVMVLFGAVGVLMKRARLSVIPLALGLVLGPILENTLGQSLILSGGSPLIFVTRPGAGVIMAVVFTVTIVLPLIQRFTGHKLVPQKEVG